MKKILILNTIFGNIFAFTHNNYLQYNLTEADKNGYIFITNTLNKDVYLVAANDESKLQYSKFNCFMVIPKRSQYTAPSPAFENIEY